jgi:ketosteroid isomerase-like protein
MNASCYTVLALGHGEEVMVTEVSITPDEVQIRQSIDGFVNAFRAKDIEGVLSLYAPEILSFDLATQLQYVGIAEYRRPWEETFPSYQEAIDYEVTNLNIRVSGELAFSHSLNRMRGTLTNGEQSELWLRWTACFQKINGKWLVTHEHVSVPINFETGSALLNLQP